MDEANNSMAQPTHRKLISQMLRPQDQVRFNTEQFGLAPIAGLQMQASTAQIGDLLLVRCNRAEWELVERAYVFNDWHRQFYHINPVFIFYPLQEADITERNPEVMSTLAHAGERLVTACRLYQTGPLLAPHYTVRFAASHGLVTRAVGPFRAEYLAYPLDGRRWLLQDSDVEAVSQVYLGLAEMEKATDTTASFRLIVEQFNLSYAPSISRAFSLHLLFTALAMAFRSSEVALDPAIDMYRRAAETVRVFAPNIPDAVEFLTNEAMSVRHQIHHNDFSSDEHFPRAIFSLRVALMMGIRALLSVHLLDQRGELAALRKEFTWTDVTSVDLFDLVLDEVIRGNRAVLHQLMNPKG